MTGVYMMTIGGKRYIGSSIDIEKRIRQHLAAMRSGCAPSALQEAFNRHGEISHTVLEIVPDTEIVWELEVRERKWIEELNPELNHLIPGNEDNSPFSLVDYAVCLLLSTHKFLATREKIDYKIRILECTARRILDIAELAKKRLSTIESALSKQNKSRRANP